MKQFTEVKIGDRVRSKNFGPCSEGCREGHDDNLIVPPGTEGTVSNIDSTGTVHVHWDNGRNLGLLPDLDEWEVLSSVTKSLA